RGGVDRFHCHVPPFRLYRNGACHTNSPQTDFGAQSEPRQHIDKCGNLSMPHGKPLIDVFSFYSFPTCLALIRSRASKNCTRASRENQGENLARAGGKPIYILHPIAGMANRPRLLRAGAIAAEAVIGNLSKKTDLWVGSLRRQA